MWVVVVQPSLFQLQWSTSIPTGAVYAQLKQSNIDESGWEFQLEMLVWWANSDGTIVYVVGEWDTLSQIAKNFGLTTSSLRSANNISDADSLFKGQKLTIDFSQEQVIFEVEASSTIADFATEYDLDLEDLMTLNYFESGDDVLEMWQQLFLDLTREEAKVKKLRQQPVYVKPEWLIEELPEDLESTTDAPSTVIEWDISASSIIDTLEPIEPESLEWDELVPTQVQQRIITSEQTTNQLEQQKLDVEKAIQAAKDEEERKKLEAEKAALEEKLAAEKLEKEAALEQERQEKIKREAEQAATAQQEAEIQQQVISAEETTDKLDTPPAPDPVPEVEQVVIEAEETTKQIKQLVECWSNKCLHNDKCRSLPSNASCAPDDTENAWVCNEGYVDTNRSCVDQATYDAQTATRGTQPAKTSTSGQYYFNPYNDGYANGRAGWHCTHYAGRYRWKHYGIMTNWRWNGGQRYRNASAAGRQTGQTPEVWAIFVWSSGSGVRSSYWHVGIVTAVDRASNSIKVSDMNYAGRYIVTERWMPINGKWMIGYVYPRKK